MLDHWILETSSDRNIHLTVLMPDTSKPVMTKSSVSTKALAFKQAVNDFTDQRFIQFLYLFMLYFNVFYL